jgi:hypothetical protein
MLLSLMLKVNNFIQQKYQKQDKNFLLLTAALTNKCIYYLYSYIIIMIVKILFV